MSKIQEIVHKFGVVTSIKQRKKKHDKMRGLNRQITVFCQQSANPDYARRHVKKALTEAGYDTTVLENNKLKS